MTNDISFKRSFCSTALAGAGIAMTASQVVVHYAVAPQQLAVAAVAGLATSVFLQAVLGMFNKQSSADIQNMRWFVVDVTSINFGLMLPLEAKFGYAQKISAFVHQYSGGLVQMGPRIEIMGYNVPINSSSPILAGFNFGFMVGNLSSRLFFLLSSSFRQAPAIP